MANNKKLKMAATGNLTNKEGEPLKVEFAPGCFDHLEVDSQEELDAIMAELTSMFATMSKEELEANSRQLTDEDIAAMDPTEREIVLQALNDVHAGERKNRLQ
jgi:hypothetical protein